MFNEPSLFGLMFFFCFFFPPADTYKRAASGVVERVMRSCVIPQKGGRLAEPEGDKPNSLFPLAR